MDHMVDIHNMIHNNGTHAVSKHLARSNFAMHKDIKEQIKVPFSKIFLDPNNPRISPDDRPGYEHPDFLFTDEVQSKLEGSIEAVYEVKDLQDSIAVQGWVPLDPIIVWEHHDIQGHYIVVEGNTRTTALRNIRKRAGVEQAKLQKMQANPKKFAKADISAQEVLVANLAQVIADTEEIAVYPMNAETPKELEEKLPAILGVRHIKHAQQWKPWATNLYMLSIYERIFEEVYGPEVDVRLESELVKRVAGVVSENFTKTRRNIQAASAFSRFRTRYEDQLVEGDEFSPSDQYYFENILQNKYCQEQFEFGKDDLHISDEREDVLFNWAFKHPRGPENDNVMQTAEDFRLWARMKRYDDDKATTFASELDVEDPDSVPPIRQIEGRFINHKNQVSPVDTVSSLLDALGEIRVPILLSQADHLKPMLSRLGDLSKTYLKLIEADK